MVTITPASSSPSSPTELTHCAPVHAGGVRVYRRGEAILEGSGYVHEGRNESGEPVVLLATYLTPKGEPLAEPD